MGKLFAGALGCCPAHGCYGYKQPAVRIAVGADRNQIQSDLFMDSSSTFSNYVGDNSETLTLGQPLEPLAMLRGNSIPAQRAKEGRLNKMC